MSNSTKTSVIMMGILLAIPTITATASDYFVGDSDTSENRAALSHVSLRNFSPVGVWHKSEGTTKIEIFRCSAAYCGKIVYLRSPIDPATGKPRTDNLNPDTSKRHQLLLGTRVLTGLVMVGPNKYQGKVYKADEGRTFVGTLILTGASTLELRGCILGGLICKSGTLVKVN